jgi:hypothetical protein
MNINQIFLIQINTVVLSKFVYISSQSVLWEVNEAYGCEKCG